MKNILVVACGGAFGAAARFIVSCLIRHDAFPWHTVVINLVGCFVAGLFTGMMSKTGALSDTAALLLITGVCGGFTTFSAFSIENVQLFLSSGFFIALLYMSLSVVGGFSLCYFGLRLSHGMQ